MRNLFIFFLIICISSGFFSPSSAQESTKGEQINLFHMSPKIGGAVGEFDLGISAGAEFGLGLRKMDLLLGFYAGSEIAIWSVPETFGQIDLMVGSHLRDGVFQINYAGGLSATWGSEGGESGAINLPTYSSLGATAKLDFMILPSPYFGLGLSFIGNVNGHGVRVMPMLGFSFGWLRDQ